MEKERVCRYCHRQLISKWPRQVYHAECWKYAHKLQVRAWQKAHPEEYRSRQIKAKKRYKERYETDLNFRLLEQARMRERSKKKWELEKKRNHEFRALPSNIQQQRMLLFAQEVLRELDTIQVGEKHRRKA